MSFRVKKLFTLYKTLLCELKISLKICLYLLCLSLSQTKVTSFHIISLVYERFKGVTSTNIFSEICLFCHKGKTAPSLISFVTSASTAELREKKLS